jgi:hypothetical protein
LSGPGGSGGASTGLNSLWGGSSTLFEHDDSVRSEPITSMATAFRMASDYHEGSRSVRLDLPAAPAAARTGRLHLDPE